MIKEKIISAFSDEFKDLKNKFEVMDILGDGAKIDYDAIDLLKLPSENNNIVWHPGVYVFIGNNCVYRIGVSLRNSRKRVMEHLYNGTSANGYNVWDIDKFEDRSILLFNVKDKIDRHWLLALEVYLESKFNPLIKAKRIG